MLKTKNIFIDTQAFIAQNFFQGKNLKRLAELGNAGHIHIFLTEITKNEVRSNIKEELNEAIRLINNFKKEIGNKGKIIKNIDSCKEYLSLPKLDFTLDFEKLAKDLDDFIIMGKISLIPFEKADLKHVFAQYFNNQKPFGFGNKKHEFPDAIVLSAIENWCEETGEKIYLLSGDSDFEGINNTNIIRIADLKDLLGQINKQLLTERSAWFTNIYKLHLNEIESKILTLFSYKLIDEVSFDIEIENLQINNLEILDYTIVEESMEDNKVTFQVDYEVTFAADFTYDDYSNAIYDKEDKQWYGYELITPKTEITTSQTAEIIIEAYFDDDYDAKEAEAEIFCSDTSIPDYQTIMSEIEGYQFGD
jgi:hypothetical protein